MARFTGKVKQFGIMAALSALMSVALVACGGGEASSNTAPPPAATNTTVASAPAEVADAGGKSSGAASGNVQDVAVTLKEWAIEPKAIEVNAGKVRFSVQNTGQFAHNMSFQIEGEGTVAKTKNFKSAEGTQVLEVDLKPGTYKMLCDIIGHPEQGMVGTLTVK